MGGVSLFSLGRKVLVNNTGVMEYQEAMDMGYFGMSFIALVIMTIALENGIHLIEHELQYSKFKFLFDAVLKELCILGFVSFSIFVLEETAGLRNTPFYIELEFTHLLVCPSPRAPPPRLPPTAPLPARDR
jgi:hypothetical protein